LAAAITCARAGLSVLVLEGAPTLGGGVRSAPLTLPGFVHDTCSAFYPLGVGSPFFRSLPLVEHGLEWVHPPAAVAHAFEDGTAAVLQRDVQATADSLGRDGKAWAKLFTPLVDHWEELLEDILAPIHLPHHPLLLARFGSRGWRTARGLAEGWFKGPAARALFAGLAAHSVQPLDNLFTAAYGLVLGILGYAVGWPIVRGGSQQLTNALASYLQSLGGELRTNTPIERFEQLPSARAVVFDVTPRQLLAIMGDRLPAIYRRPLRKFRYGPGVFKCDWALRGPIPWKAPGCKLAGTVHLGGRLEEIAEAEISVAKGEVPSRPFVLVGQQSLFDPSRAPAGQHTAWAYCHVPNGCELDMTESIEKQIERFAPGFRDLVLARHSISPKALEKYNPNNIGGDISAGAMKWDQLFTRPIVSLVPYATSARGVYICSGSTAPGGGVHGMCGYHAARTLLRREFRKTNSN